MNISQKLLDLIACPETHLPLTPATVDIIALLNKKIDTCELKDRSSNLVTMPIEGGFVRSDGKVLYPVWQGIPVLLIEKAIELN
jgi:uncharacterized protein YbaR (Trm112 family)